VYKDEQNCGSPHFDLYTSDCKEEEKDSGILEIIESGIT
jgi:hypothetical protein